MRTKWCIFILADFSANILSFYRSFFLLLDFDLVLSNYVVFTNFGQKMSFRHHYSGSKTQVVR